MSSPDHFTILWRRLDLPGHEVAELDRVHDGWRLQGVAVLAHAGQPCRFQYVIECDEAWRTRTVHVDGHVDGAPRSLHLERSASGEWFTSNREIPAVRGCIDVDLAFSPCTNTLPIRRLDLSLGASAHVRAAWVRFPELTVEPLDQTYTRSGPERYLYESNGGAFRRELTVDASGFVLDYPDLWHAEARTGARRITGFHTDEEGHWVADLECGHTQHVRHDPPWQNRPWVVTPEGRALFLGVQLVCVECLKSPGTRDWGLGTRD